MGETSAERAERLSRSLVEAMEAVPDGQATPLGRALRELVGAGFPWADAKVGGGRLWTMDRLYRRWLAIGLRAGYAFGLGSGDRKAAEAFFGPTGPIHGLRTTAEAAQEALRRLLVNEHVDVDELQRTHDELRAALHATDHWRQTPADEPYVEPVEAQAWRELYTKAGNALEARWPILVAALRAAEDALREARS